MERGKKSARVSVSISESTVKTKNRFSMLENKSVRECVPDSHSKNKNHQDLSVSTVGSSGVKTRRSKNAVSCSVGSPDSSCRNTVSSIGIGLPIHRFGSIQIEEDRLWHLNVKGSRHVSVGALIDSGAVTSSVVSPQFIEKLGNIRVERCGPYPTSFSVSGIELFITQYARLSITCPVFGSTAWKFYVLPHCTSDLVIGKDFLKHFKGLHDYDTDILTFKNAPSGPGVPKGVQLRALSVNASNEPGSVFRAGESETSDEEGEVAPRVRVAPINDEDHRVLDYYMNLNKSEADVAPQDTPTVKEQLPKRVATKRPFKVRGLHMHKVSVRTDSNYTGDLILEASDLWMRKCGLISVPGVVHFESGFGHTWVANPNIFPVTMPPQLKFAACHIVVNKADSEKSVAIEPDPPKLDPLSDEELSQFNFGPHMSDSQKKIITAILNKFKNAFAWSDDDLTGIVDEHGNLIEAKVELTDKVPVNIKPRRNSPEAKRQVGLHMARE